MRIGYDVRFVASSRQVTGIGRYAVDLLAEMTKLVDVELFSDRDWLLPEALRGAKLNVLSSCRLWQQTALPLGLWKRKVDLFHGLAYGVPFWAPCPQVVTVHDLGFRHARETQALDVRRYLSKMVPIAMARASQIIVPSEAVRYDIGKYYGTYRSKVRVTPLGVGTAFLLAGLEGQETERGSVENTPYILTVGTHEPRKNLRRVVESFLQLVRDENIPHKLVMVGGETQATNELRKLVADECSDRVLMVGYVPEERLIRYYQGADFLVYPSLFEGFGIPLLEAMATGCPIVTSNVSSMPEVAGDAALYVDPTDSNSIRAAMSRLLHDRELRKVLRQRGLSRVQHYKWSAVAQQTLTVYEGIKG